MEDLKKTCAVCKSQEVLHNNPWNLIWICDRPHREYHDGKISLYKDTLTWNPDRLIRIKGLINIPQNKERNFIVGLTSLRESRNGKEKSDPLIATIERVLNLGQFI